MAYQLIYTSAPRALEAGRSGFCTVARHREIPPQLVAVLERISQFSRLPGEDIDRVVLSHRIINVSGARFHVLSSIRDAGADYTGRTNHIAHHLVISPAEIAQLGTSCPSPAEVLVAMPWQASWEGPPGFFLESDEISLAQFPPRQRLSAWGRLTGDANQARILSSGDAIRGAYVIHSASADLCEIFHESLLHAPERLWQISFTNSLQPSDEISDFRWIGLETSSPLRAQAEESGRLVFNLSEPHSLPKAELPQTSPSDAPPQQPDHSLPAQAPHAFHQHEQTAEFPQIRGTFYQHNEFPVGAFQTVSGLPDFSRTKPKAKKYLFPALVVLALVVLAGVWDLNKREQQFEEDIDKTLSNVNAAYSGTGEDLKREAARLGAGSREAVREIAQKLSAIFNLIHAESPEDSTFKDLDYELKAVNAIRLEKAANVNFSKALHRFLEDSMKYVDAFNQADLPTGETIDEKLGSITDSLNKFEKYFAENKTLSNKKTYNEVTNKLKQKRGELLHSLLREKAPPSNRCAEFQGKYGYFKDYDDVVKILDLWRKAESFLNNPSEGKKWTAAATDLSGAAVPEWLAVKIEECQKFAAAPVAPVPPSAVAPAAIPPPIPPTAVERPVRKFLVNSEDWKVGRRLTIPLTTGPDALEILPKDISLEIKREPEPAFNLRLKILNFPNFTEPNYQSNIADPYFSLEMLSREFIELKVSKSAVPKGNTDFDLNVRTEKTLLAKIEFRRISEQYVRQDVLALPIEALQVANGSISLSPELKKKHERDTLSLRFRSHGMNQPFKEISACEKSLRDLSEKLNQIETLRNNISTLDQQTSDFRSQLKSQIKELTDRLLKLSPTEKAKLGARCVSHKLILFDGRDLAPWLLTNMEMPFVSKSQIKNIENQIQSLRNLIDEAKKSKDNDFNCLNTPLNNKTTLSCMEGLTALLADFSRHDLSGDRRRGLETELAGRIPSTADQPETRKDGLMVGTYLIVSSSPLGKDLKHVPLYKIEVPPDAPSSPPTSPAK